MESAQWAGTERVRYAWLALACPASAPKLCDCPAAVARGHGQSPLAGYPPPFLKQMNPHQHLPW